MYTYTLAMFDYLIGYLIDGYILTDCKHFVYKSTIEIKERLTSSSVRAAFDEW